MKKIPIAVVTEGNHLNAERRLCFHAQLAEKFDARFLEAAEHWDHLSDHPDIQRADAVLVYARLRFLTGKPATRWGSYRGLKIFYDEDMCQERAHHSLNGRSNLGVFSSQINFHGFSHILTTDYQYWKSFRNEELRCEWLPKYFNPDFFSILEGHRTGICTYGKLYDARKAVLARIKKEPIAIHSFKCPYDELNATLSRHLGAIVCNLAVDYDKTWQGFLRRVISRIPKLGTWVHKKMPLFGARFYPTLGTMWKNFEVAAAGCAPFMDWGEELYVLGFQEGESAIFYHSIDELVEKLRYYQERPDELRRIGRQAQALVWEKHRVDVRALQLQGILQSWLEERRAPGSPAP